MRQTVNSDFRAERFQTLELVVLGYAEARRQEIPISFIEDLQADFGLELTLSEKLQLTIESKKYLKATNFWFDFGGTKKQAAMEKYFEPKYQNINPDYDQPNTEVVLFLLHLTTIKADYYKSIFEKYTSFISVINNHIKKLMDQFYVEEEQNTEIKNQAMEYFNSIRKSF